MLKPDQVEALYKQPELWGAYERTAATETIHTLADALREAVGALRWYAAENAYGQFVNSAADDECGYTARKALAAIESKVPREWLVNEDN